MVCVLESPDHTPGIKNRLRALHRLGRQTGQASPRHNASSRRLRVSICDNCHEMLSPPISLLKPRHAGYEARGQTAESSWSKTSAKRPVLTGLTETVNAGSAVPPRVVPLARPGTCSLLPKSRCTLACGRLGPDFRRAVRRWAHASATSPPPPPWPPPPPPTPGVIGAVNSGTLNAASRAVTTDEGYKRLGAVLWYLGSWQYHRVLATTGLGGPTLMRRDPNTPPIPVLHPGGRDVQPIGVLSRPPRGMYFRATATTRSGKSLHCLRILGAQPRIWTRETDPVSFGVHLGLSGEPSRGAYTSGRWR